MTLHSDFYHSSDTSPNILAIDTVFEQCSVAVWQNRQLTQIQTMLGKREQTQMVLPMIDAVIKQANLSLGDFDAIAFNRGPGAFSGIRIDTAVTQALSFAYDLPCVAVSSLQIMAQAAYEQYGYHHVYACLDARMQQVYVGEFAVKDGRMQSAMDDNPCQQSEHEKDLQTTEPMCVNEYLLDYQTQTQADHAIVGNGAFLLTARSNQSQQTELTLDAGILAKLAAAQYICMGGVPAEQALPVYLRHNAWKTLKEQGKA